MKGTRTSGFIMLFLGAGLLTVTFMLAMLNLYGNIATIFGGGLTEILGASFGLLLNACVRAIYLGIMGWVGSIITARGVALLKGDGSAETEKAAKNTSQGKKEAAERRSEKEDSS